MSAEPLAALLEHPLAELLLHPIRWGIVQAVAQAGRAAPKAIGAARPDVPTATLYRQIGKLAEAGVLVVVATRQARGATERVYALGPEAARLVAGLGRQPEAAPAAVAPAPADPFLAFAASLAEAYREATQDAAGRRVGAAHQVHTLHLSDDELETVMEGIRDALAPALRYGPAPWRKPRLVATASLPAQSAPGV